VSRGLAIEAEGLSKRFQLGRVEDHRYRTLRDAIAGWTRRPVKPARAAAGPAEIWALKDVSFEVQEGEAIGIVGRNGAGKSTLLKILSRITEPTEGRALIRGRVASLLEVGTGFHPELTGRENIFLNGAILGMTRAEIVRSFDAIVAFAEIEAFLDTPVKRYSSGMYVRLAFAVAAHLTPEVLMVDEVLAVGDYEFQRRCLGRMNSVARSGRTVLFVSHNLWAIEELCPRTMLLDHGHVAMLGPTAQVLGQYLSASATAASSWEFPASFAREGNGRARITKMELRAADGATLLNNVACGASFRIRLYYRAFERVSGPTFGLALLTERDERIFLTHTMEEGITVAEIEGEGVWDCLVQTPNLLPGTYRIEAWITDVFGVTACDHLRMVGRVEIVIGAHSGRLAGLQQQNRGHVFMKCDWIHFPGTAGRLNGGGAAS